MLKEKGIYFMDVGTSGGLFGLKEGYCLTVGGDEKAFEINKPIFKSLSSENGFGYVGPSGSGHFVKMIHNGIEYGILQAMGEGFSLMESKKEFSLDLEKIASIWENGSVVRSWLLSLVKQVFKKNPTLESIEGYVEDSGEGRWTVLEGIENKIPVPVLSISLMERFSSRSKNAFSNKLISSLRNLFGGHRVKKR